MTLMQWRWWLRARQSHTGTHKLQCRFSNRERCSLFALDCCWPRVKQYDPRGSHKWLQTCSALAGPLRKCGLTISLSASVMTILTLHQVMPHNALSLFT